MSARTRLNMMNIYGALLIGAVLGSVTGSWLVFFLTAAALIGGEIHSGDIRFSGEGGGKSPRRDRRK